MKGSCYLCGASDPETRDHIPPRGFFPSPRPTDLITVPCCRSCNNGLSKEDDYFRLVLSSAYGRSSSGDDVWETSALPRSVPRLPKEVDALLHSLVDTVIETESGLAEVSAIQVDPARLRRFAIRLTKGLLTHYFPEYDYSDAHFDVRHIMPTERNLAFLQTVRGLMSFDERGDRVFRYRFSLTDTKQSGLWMLTFYDAVLIVVGHRKKTAQPGATDNPGDAQRLRKDH